MKTATARWKWVMILAIAAAAMVAAAGAAWAETRDDVQGPDRNRAASAAVKEAGGGTATDVERSDDGGEAYEVEVRQTDGTEVDVALDAAFRVLDSEVDDEAVATDDNDDNPDSGRDD